MRKGTALLAILLVLAVQFSVLWMPSMDGNTSVQLCPMHAMMSQSSVADISQNQNQTNNQGKQTNFCPFCSARTAAFIAQEWVNIPLSTQIALYAVPVKQNETAVVSFLTHDNQPRGPPALS